MRYRAAASLVSAGLALAFLSFTAFASVPVHSRLRIAGTEYVSVNDWARSHGFTRKWTVPRDEMRLSNSHSSILLKADSRKIVLNASYLAIRPMQTT